MLDAATSASAYASYGDDSGLDPDHPFEFLRFRDPVSSGDGRVSMVVELVRNERVATTVLGVDSDRRPAGSDGRARHDHLARATTDAPPSWLPFNGLESYSWKISSIDDSPD